MTEFNNQELNQPFTSEVKEDLEANIEADFNQEMRKGFIRKVYGILTGQLLITTGFICLSFITPIKEFLSGNLIAMYCCFGCLGVVLIISIILCCCKKIARKVPLNYIFLFTFTICESYCLLFICTAYEPYIVLMALLGTAGITATLTVYACTTKTDFTFLGSFLFCGVFLLIFGGIICGVFWSYYYWNLLYCILGLLIYSLYLIFDTQLIMGKFGIEYQIDDYIIASLQIYIDIIQIFLYLLSILGGGR